MDLADPVAAMDPAACSLLGQGEGVVPEWEMVRWGRQEGRRVVGVGKEREWALAARRSEGEGKE
jgi:hypothetical protein